MGKKRTPSPRVIAAKMMEHFDEAVFFRTAEEMTEKCGTKISPEKRDKVLAVVEKLAAPLKKRLKKIIDNFERPPPRKPKVDQ